MVGRQGGGVLPRKLQNFPPLSLNSRRKRNEKMARRYVKRKCVRRRKANTVMTMSVSLSPMPTREKFRERGRKEEKAHACITTYALCLSMYEGREENERRRRRGNEMKMPVS